MITNKNSWPGGCIRPITLMLVPLIIIASFHIFRPPIVAETDVLKEKLPPPKILLGFSTGHTGTTTVDAVLGGNTSGCPWQERFGRFERRFPRQETIVYTSQEKQCIWVQKHIIPQMTSDVHSTIKGRNGTYVDMGHFSNLGYVLECLADSPMAATGELAWVRIRRNRYDIARSFSEQFDSPCHNPGATQDVTPRQHRIPSVSYCPHSQERHNTPIYLPIPDEVWMGLTPFQKFLWLADELEYRFHTLQQRNHTNFRSYEITWSLPHELKPGIDNVLEQLDCQTSQEIPQKKIHVEHAKKNCTEDIHADRDYRRKVQFSPEVQKVLFQYTTIDTFDLENCQESRDELEVALKEMAFD